MEQRHFLLPCPYQQHVEILFENLLQLFPVASSPKSASLSFPTSVSYYQAILFVLVPLQHLGSQLQLPAAAFLLWVYSASSSFFGTALSSFGDQNSFLGSQFTTPTFGTTGFAQSVFCSQHGRSRVAAYTATAEVDDGSSAAKLESISAMTINKDKSHEELRWESVWKLLVLVIHLEGV